MSVMNLYASDEYYMAVMNIIYSCDDICDLYEYLRLLEKSKKKKKKEKNSLPRAKATALGEGGAQHYGVYKPSPRAEGTTLGEEHPFNESQIFCSQRRTLLQREPNIWLSAKEWPPLLTEGRAVMVRGPSARAKDASRRMSALRIQ
jgi:hypothetical protein